MKIAVIPARGGSKRIPRKNIKLFDGQPIIAYSIEAALKSGVFDQVIVSTDDREIAETAEKFGAIVPFLRPSDLADDFTNTNAVIKHAIEWFRQNGQSVEFACSLYATAPFIKPEYLIEAFEKLSLSNKSFAISVTTYPFPIQRAVRINSEGSISPFYPEHMATRSQDLDDAYHDAGQFCLGRAEAFLSEEVVFSEHTLPVVIPRYLVQDIDTVEDWAQAEIMFKVLEMQSKGLGS